MEDAAPGPDVVRDYATDISDDQPIWHYRQFAEFVAVLQKRALWFSRLDTLREPFEGVSGRKSKFHDAADEHTRKSCVNCWAVDNEESELMWCAYAPGNGIAIRSTKTRLKASFLPPEAKKIIIAPMEYGMDWSHGLPHFMEINCGYAFHKRRPFKWERELRVLLPCEYQWAEGTLIEPAYTGKSVPVNIKRLVAEIWVAPYAPDWFREMVKTELEQYGYGEIPVRMREEEP